MNRKVLKSIALAAVFSLAAGSTGADAFPGAFPPSVSGNAYANVEIADQNVFRHPSLASSSDQIVGTQLVLAMDTSGSMDTFDFELQLEATARALNSEMVRNAIKYRTGERSVAIAVIDFDSAARLRIAWVDIRGDEINDRPYDPDNPQRSSAAPDRLDLLANEIMTLPRRGNGGTNITTAINLSRNLFLQSPWGIDTRFGERVLDVFGDGTSTGSLTAARDNFEKIGGTINGFAIVNEDQDLDAYFRRELVTDSRVRSEDGITSEYGRVWAITPTTPSASDEDGRQAYISRVVRGMTQKISIEIAGIQDYYRIYASLQERNGSDPAVVPAVPAPNNDG